MTARLRNYSMTDAARPGPGGDDAVKASGHRAQQVRVLVRATNLAAAAEAIGTSRYYLTTYGGETWNREQVEWLDQFPPGTVLVTPLDPFGTVKGGQKVAVR